MPAATLVPALFFSPITQKAVENVFGMDAALKATAAATVSANGTVAAASFPPTSTTGTTDAFALFFDSFVSLWFRSLTVTLLVYGASLSTPSLAGWLLVAEWKICRYVGFVWLVQKEERAKKKWEFRSVSDWVQRQIGRRTGRKLGGA